LNELTEKDGFQKSDAIGREEILAVVAMIVHHANVSIVPREEGSSRARQEILMRISRKLNQYSDD
jgi:hypothetical protein